MPIGANPNDLGKRKRKKENKERDNIWNIYMYMYNRMHTTQINDNTKNDWYQLVPMTHGTQNARWYSYHTS